MKKKRIIVIGGGFGGYLAAKRLKSFFDVILVSDRDYFLFTPLLHEVATGGLNPDSVMFKFKTKFSFIKCRVKKINLEKQIVHLKTKKLNYDYLIIASGSKTSFFNIDSKLVYKLKTIDDAKQIHNRLVKLKENGEGTITIVGGGATGCELAAEIAQFSKGTNIRTNLISASEFVLKNQNIFLQKIAFNRLKSMNIRILNNRKVKKVETKKLILDNAEVINSDVIIWVAGVSPNYPENNKYASKSIPVQNTLQLYNYKNVFAIGDCNDKSPLLAQTAEGQSKICVKNIINLEKKRPLESYKWKSKGFLLSLGNGFAIADIKSVRISGFFTWWLWRTIYLSKVPSIKNKFLVMCHWTMMLFKKRKNNV